MSEKVMTQKEIYNELRSNDPKMMLNGYELVQAWIDEGRSCISVNEINSYGLSGDIALTILKKLHKAKYVAPYESGCCGEWEFHNPNGHWEMEFNVYNSIHGHIGEWSHSLLVGRNEMAEAIAWAQERDGAEIKDRYTVMGHAWDEETETIEEILVTYLFTKTYIWQIVPSKVWKVDKSR